MEFFLRGLVSARKSGGLSPTCLQSSLWEVRTRGEFTHRWLKFPVTEHKKSLMSSVPKPQLQDVGTSPCIIVGQKPVSIHPCANTWAFFVCVVVLNLWKPQALASLFLPFGISHLLFSNVVSCVQRISKELLSLNLIRLPSLCCPTKCQAEVKLPYQTSAGSAGFRSFVWAFWSDRKSECSMSDLSLYENKGNFWKSPLNNCGLLFSHFRINPTVYDTRMAMKLSLGMEVLHWIELWVKNRNWRIWSKPSVAKNSLSFLKHFFFFSF